MIVYDVETVPHPRALAEPYPQHERQHPSNYKDPEKIAAWYIRDEAEWAANRAKECALSPLMCRIVAIGIHADGCEPISAIAMDESEERDIVELALRTMHNAGTGTESIVTFNGWSFDLPVTFLRAAMLDIEVPFHTAPYLRRYVNKPHTDTRMVISNWDVRAEGKLEDCCKAFGIDVPDETSGADIYRFFKNGDADSIRRHNLADLAKTRQLATKLDRAGLI